MGEGGEHGVGGGLPQAAQGGLLDVVAQLLDGVQILRLAVALGDLGQQIQQRLVPIRQGEHLPQDSSTMNSR